MRVFGEQPLYFGSRVAFGTDKLLPQDYHTSISPFLEEDEDENDLNQAPPKTGEDLLRFTGMSAVEIWRWYLAHQECGGRT